MSARWPVEGGEEPVPRGMALDAAVPVEVVAGELVVPAEYRQPLLVAEAGEVAGGVDDVGEHHGGKRSVGFRAGAARP